MDIPETVCVLGVPYRVERGGCEPDENGWCSPSKRVIAIREGLCPEEEAQTFLHELLHAILQQLARTFWSSGILTGNQTRGLTKEGLDAFWSSGILTGNQTHHFTSNRLRAFWSSGILTGNQTSWISRMMISSFWSSGILTGNQTRLNNKIIRT